MDEIAQHYSRQSVRFVRVDTAQLAYSDMIKMGVTTTPVIRLHTQVSVQDNADMMIGCAMSITHGQSWLS